MRTIALLGVLLCAGAVSAAHVYIPFTNVLTETGQDQGLWLADSDHLGSPPIQVTDQLLDGPATFNLAVLHDWTLDPATRLATRLTPRMAVYGVGGRLFKVDLQHAGPAEQLTNGTYQELCSLLALDQRPFNESKAFVQAIVQPVGSPNTCADNLGTVTWLIPASAGARTAAIVEPAFWNVLGAFTDPADGKFVEWLVWTGTEVAAYSDDFRSHRPILTGIPQGFGPVPMLRIDSTFFLSATVVSDAGSQTDTVFRVTPASSSVVGNFTRAASSFCNGSSLGSLPDRKTGKIVFTEPTDTGYALFTAPLSGGRATQIYADDSVFNCGSVAGDAISKGFAGVTVFEGLTGREHAIGVNESGPVTQTPVHLAGDANSTADVHYTIDGHLWVDVLTLSPVRTRSTLVVDGDGTKVLSFAAGLSGDVVGGNAVSGDQSALQRERVYLFSAAPGHCAGGTLSLVNPITFDSVAVDGLPADTCSVFAFGYPPASTGSVTTPGGSEPVQIDPATHRLHQLAEASFDGTFSNLEQILFYPFN